MLNNKIDDFICTILFEYLVQRAWPIAPLKFNKETTTTHSIQFVWPTFQPLIFHDRKNTYSTLISSWAIHRPNFYSFQIDWNPAALCWCDFPLYRCVSCIPTDNEVNKHVQCTRIVKRYGMNRVNDLSIIVLHLPRAPAFSTCVFFLVFNNISNKNNKRMEISIWLRCLYSIYCLFSLSLQTNFMTSERNSNSVKIISYEIKFRCYVRWKY